MLLDWTFPGRSQEDSLAGLLALGCCPRVIVLSTRMEMKEEALKAGADAFVSKGDSPQKLLEAVRGLEH